MKTIFPLHNTVRLDYQGIRTKQVKTLLIIIHNNIRRRTRCSILFIAVLILLQILTNLDVSPV
jgi:hypothetical protein